MTPLYGCPGDPLQSSGLEARNRRDAAGLTMEVRLPDGRIVVVHAAGEPGAPAVLWHHGSPQTGALLEPVVAAAAEHGLRLAGYGRPGYGGSTPHPGRDVAAAAADVAAIADALGLGRFAVMGASGGGPHALACAALLPERVTAAVTLAGLAPRDRVADWFAGMADPGALRAATRGRDARAAFAAAPEDFDPSVFTEADWSALDGTWAPLGADAGAAHEAGTGGLIDDDVAFAAPWGFALEDVAVPVLVVHGGEDRMVPPAHADALVRDCPGAELWLRPRDGHVSVLGAIPAALEWILPSYE